MGQKDRIWHFSDVGPPNSAVKNVNASMQNYNWRHAVFFSDRNPQLAFGF